MCTISLTYNEKFLSDFCLTSNREEALKVKPFSADLKSALNQKAKIVLKFPRNND